MFKRSLLAVALLLASCGAVDDSGQTSTTPTAQAGTEAAGAGAMCDTCRSDDDCGGNLRCGKSAVCVTACGPGGACPTHFACDDVTGQCLPEAGACDGTAPVAPPAEEEPATGEPSTQEPAPAEPPPAPKCTEDTWDNYIGAQMMDRCERCHSFARTLEKTQAKADDIAGKIDAGDGGKHDVPQPDYDRIMKWLSCGAQTAAQ